MGYMCKSLLNKLRICFVRVVHYDDVMEPSEKPDPVGMRQEEVAQDVVVIRMSSEFVVVPSFPQMVQGILGHRPTTSFFGNHHGERVGKALP